MSFPKNSAAAHMAARMVDMRRYFRSLLVAISLISFLASEILFLASEILFGKFKPVSENVID
jgi:hypothetical protein